MTDRPVSPDPDQQTAVATYVATLSADLSAMARHNGLPTLGYLLEMVRLEAETVARGTPPGLNGRNGR